MEKSESIFKLLQELLPLLEEYSSTQGDKNLYMRGFTFWLFQKISNEMDNELSFNSHNTNPAIGKAPLDMQVLYLTTHLSRFSNHYIKKALEGTDFVRPDDFHYLAVLAHTDSMTKSELIYSNITSMPSGIEVIKRLLKTGFIEEFADPNDKRSKRVRITESGYKEVMKTADEMAKAGKILGADLTNKEKLTLVTLLELMNNYHTDSFEKDRTKSLDNLLEKIIKKTESINNK